MVSPEILASKMNQLSVSGVTLIIIKRINSDKIALKLFVLKFSLIKSNFLIPENSILIRWSPIVPIISGNKKLKKLGKNEKIEFFKTR